MEHDIPVIKTLYVYHLYTYYAVNFLAGTQTDLPTTVFLASIFVQESATKWQMTPSHHACSFISLMFLPISGGRLWIRIFFLFGTLL